MNEFEKAKQILEKSGRTYFLMFDEGDETKGTINGKGDKLIALNEQLIQGMLDTLVSKADKMKFMVTVLSMVTILLERNFNDDDVTKILNEGDIILNLYESEN